MNRHLLDVNVFLALVWPRHADHAAAHAWFGKSGHQGWASNSLTQLGLLRLLTNPAVTQGAVSAATALELLAQATRHPGHEFWPLDRELPPGLRASAPRVLGHRQWADTLLLCHAAEHGGTLVTFDAGIRELAHRELRKHLLVLKP